MKKLVRRKVDLQQLPPLSVQQTTELASLRRQGESQVDYSDIPALDTTFWEEAKQGRFYRTLKCSTTLRLDADVLAWLRAQGRGYQTRINGILRREMLASLKQPGSR